MAEQLCMGCMNKFDENDSVCPYCGYRVDTPPAEPYHLAPGVILGGKYIVGKTIGYGGFSVTYLAYDYSLEKKIAIKEYLPSELQQGLLAHQRYLSLVEIGLTSLTEE